MGWNPFAPKLPSPGVVADQVMQRLRLEWGDDQPRVISQSGLRRAVEIVATIAQGRGVANGGVELATLFKPIDQ